MSQQTSEWTTSIAEVQGDEVILKGYKLSDLVGKVTFTDMIFLIFSGELPGKEKRNMLEAIFVTLIDHGISPTTIISRMLTSCGTPLQSAIAGSVLSIADWHGGSCEQVAKNLHEVVENTKKDETPIKEDILRGKLAELVAEYRRQKKLMEGFGHPQHKEGDPRANMLFNLADELGVTGIYTRTLILLGEELSKSLGRPMPANITGAIASLLLDMGFPWQSIRGFVISPRVMGITAHSVEELEQGGRWRHASSENVNYTGPKNRTLNE